MWSYIYNKINLVNCKNEFNRRWSVPYENSNIFFQLKKCALYIEIIKGFDYCEFSFCKIRILLIINK